jgi:hypothetical protein
VAISLDSKIILAGTDDNAWLWKLPPPLKSLPEEVVLWAQVLTCMELDEVGVVHPLNAREWQQRRRLLDELGRPPMP